LRTCLHTQTLIRSYTTNFKYITLCVFISGAISENESLFTYPNGRPFSSYQNQSFNPVVVIPENVSQEIRDVCGTNYECIYDYYVTGDENLGQISANFSDQFDVITNITAAGKYILNVRRV